MNENMVTGFVMAALAAAVGGIVVWHYATTHPIGGGQPLQMTSYSPTNNITPQVPGRTDADAAPVSQNTPITEAAYNQQPTEHAPAFGRNTNQNETAGAVVIPW